MSRIAATDSALAAHHFVDPDRGKGRGAAFGGGVVTIESPPLSDGESPLAMGKGRERVDPIIDESDACQNGHIVNPRF